MSVETRPDVSVIIVSYNTRAMTLDCLRALKAGLGGLSAEILLVDNASKDGSAAAVRENFPDVRVIDNDRNAGFGAANNIAMAQAKGEFLLLLNSDAFPEPDAIPALLAALRENPRAAVAGPRLSNADGSLQISCFRFPSPARASGSRTSGFPRPSSVTRSSMTTGIGGTTAGGGWISSSARACSCGAGSMSRSAVSTNASSCIAKSRTGNAG